MSDKPTTPPRPPLMPPARGKYGVLQGPNSGLVNLKKLEPVFQPPRIVLNAVEGWGKTSCAAFATNPGILMAQGETGYETLLGVGLVPQVPSGYITEWTSLLLLLDKLATTDTPAHAVLALDALGGFERLCHQYVCDRDFEGNWGEKGFSSYQKGYDLSVTDWLTLLARLDRVRAKGTTILLLGHVQVRPFKNPLGEDFDRYVSDVHHKTWGATHKWADAVLFGQFRTVFKTQDGRTKGIGGTERVLYCERRDAYDAKNRYGLPDELDIPNDPKLIWPTIWSAITKEKKNASG